MKSLKIAIPRKLDPFPLYGIHLGLIGQFHYQALEIDYYHTTSTASQFLAAIRQTQGRLHRLTEGAVRNQQVISEMIQNDDAYRFLKNVRGSPDYFQRVMYDVFKMIRQLRLPTWFLTQTCSGQMSISRPSSQKKTSNQCNLKRRVNANHFFLESALGPRWSLMICCP